MIPSPAPPNVDVTLNRLEKVSQFAFGGVGFAGVTSEGETDYSQIYARPTAVVDFRKVFQAGNMQAKCYALTALFTLNHEQFLQLAESLRKSDAQVSVMTGCVMSHRPVSAVINEIEAGIYSPKK